MKNKKTSITLSNERKETVYRYDVDMAPWVYDFYVEHGRKMIQDDSEALFNYGVVAVLKDALKKPVKKNKKVLDKSKVV